MKERECTNNRDNALLNSNNVISNALFNNDSVISTDDNTLLNNDNVLSSTYNISNISVFSEFNILSVLYNRYINNTIYTMYNNNIISINPYKYINNYNTLYNILYTIIDNNTDSTLSSNNNTICNKLYNSNNTAYNTHSTLSSNNNTICNKLYNSSIIVLSGESGAGKSVNTNYILKYIYNNVYKTVYSNYLIELFGNSSTCNNNNSSRYGKFINIEYNTQCIISISIKIFLLESGRIEKRKNNFHSIKLINEVLSGREKKRVNRIFNIFNKLCISNSIIIEIFKYLVIIKYLIDIEIEDSSGSINITGRVDEISYMLRIDKNILLNLLLKKEITVNNENILKYKKVQESINTKNTLIRVIYEKVFYLIIDLINKGLKDISKERININDILNSTHNVNNNNNYDTVCNNNTEYNTHSTISNNYDTVCNNNTEYNKHSTIIDEDSKLNEEFKGLESGIQGIQEDSEDYIKEGMDKFIEEIHKEVDINILNIEDIERSNRSNEDRSSAVYSNSTTNANTSTNNGTNANTSTNTNGTVYTSINTNTTTNTNNGTNTTTTTNNTNNTTNSNSTANTSSSDVSVMSIGILDIYGFEILEENGFDQFCINYANEKLQSEYVSRIITENVNVLNEEGIPFDRLDKICNKDIFEGPSGLIRLLDEECLLNGSVNNWLSKISSSVRVYGKDIIVKHYAGDVKYNTEDFMERNKNEYSDVSKLLNSTGIRLLYQSDKYIGRLSKKGVLGEFKDSLDSLISYINSSRVYYIRCINPGINGDFMTEVGRQLKQAGIYDTIKIFMLGFHVKYTKQEYIERYLNYTGDIKEGENNSVEIGGREGVKVGKKYVFITETAYKLLEKERKYKIQQEIEERKRKEEIEYSTRIIKQYITRVQVLKEIERIQKEREEERVRHEEEERVRQEEEERVRHEEEERVRHEEEERVRHEEEERIKQEEQMKQEEANNIIERHDEDDKIEKQDEDEKVEIHDEDDKQEDINNSVEECTKDNLLDSINNIEIRNSIISTSNKSINNSVYNSYPTSPDTSEDHIKAAEVVNPCSTCHKTEEKYSLQLLYLQEKHNEINKLSTEVSKYIGIIKDKDTLIRDLSHKIEVLLYDMSTEEYSKRTTNPLHGVNIIKPHDKAPTEIFRKILKVFMQSVPSEYKSYYDSVTCAFTLFRVAAVCPGGISGNIPGILQEFELAVHSVFSVKKCSIPVYTGFFLINAMFIAKTSPSSMTESILQKVFSSGCRSICEEISNFGFDFLFKPASDGGNLLTRLLKKPSLDSVISHLRMIHSILNNLCVPEDAIVSIFEYISRVIDVSGFESIIKKDKRIGAKHLLYLQSSLDSLAGFFMEIQVDNPFYFPYLKKFIEFVDVQRKGVITGSVFLRVGPFSSSHLKASINALSPEIRGKFTSKMQSALTGVPPISKIQIPSPEFTAPMCILPDDPNELYIALIKSLEREQISNILEEYNIPNDWLNS
ncbi:uncharacterized protein NEPG_01457 [Nematocida parisii ERTm1]|uniref:uncharacterized protein n=1 Tax=Nematocida parisii (strain ERTm1 / ATCC PRA-289) TaxID=881290 RepID=UPI000264B790|nr:uncharacterized protein NEPG_01457 [Nematocida parisii ERTm1]EIJ93885.1 hypothetical protein NEPG_01457 [Nematocida parisii ERTm1]|eukprot:XP_013059285.1 hypothetical protein NEPG_01457 [Nematocida parisii ERTm1]